jgi:hypothetical protein
MHEPRDLAPRDTPNLKLGTGTRERESGRQAEREKGRKGDRKTGRQRERETGVGGGLSESERERRRVRRREQVNERTRDEWWESRLSE